MGRTTLKEGLKVLRQPNDLYIGVNLRYVSVSLTLVQIPRPSLVALGVGLCTGVVVGSSGGMARVCRLLETF